jgi:hypothetical protein
MAPGANAADGAYAARFRTQRLSAARKAANARSMRSTSPRRSACAVARTENW